MAIPKINYVNIEIKSPYTNKVLNFRPILARDINEELTIGDDDKQAQIRYICNMLHRCIIGDEAELNTLYYFEVVYMYLKLKAASDTPILNAMMKCIEHDKDFKVAFDLDKLETPEFDKKAKHVELSNGWVLHLDYYKYSDIKDLTEETDKTINYKIIKGCTIHGEYKDWTKETVEELKSFVEDLSAKDIQLYNEFILDTPMPYLTYDSKCSECTETQESRLYELNHFFL